MAEQLYGADFITEWKELTLAYGRAAHSQDPALAAAVIQHLGEYRFKHPNLYRDKGELESRRREKPAEPAMKQEPGGLRIKLVRK